MDLHSGGRVGRDGPSPKSKSATFRKTACTDHCNEPTSDAYARPMPLILIGIGGFAGAISRYLVDGFVTDRTAGAFPWGTLVVNATGSFVLGLLFAATTERAIFPAEIRGPVMIGFIGAYTTFSSFSYETFTLGRADRVVTAAVYVAVSVVGGILAALAGYLLARRIA